MRNALRVVCRCTGWSFEINRVSVTRSNSVAIKGSCLCGGVTFEIDRAVGPMEICHCNRCRKVSGTASLVAVSVRKEDYHFIRGAELITTYQAPILNEPPPYVSMFCSRCGSQVPPPEPSESLFEICPGLFDQDLGIQPDKHTRIHARYSSLS